MISSACSLWMYCSKAANPSAFALAFNAIARMCSHSLPEAIFLSIAVRLFSHNKFTRSDSLNVFFWRVDRKYKFCSTPVRHPIFKKSIQVMLFICIFLGILAWATSARTPGKKKSGKKSAGSGWGIMSIQVIHEYSWLRHQWKCQTGSDLIGIPIGST